MRTDLAGNEARTLILRARAGVFAAEVHQVLGLRNVATSALRAPQRAEAGGLFLSEYDTKDGAVTVVDIERLFDALARS
jgi:chemotaxis signal transduction protein